MPTADMHKDIQKDPPTTLAQIKANSQGPPTAYNPTLRTSKPPGIPLWSVAQVESNPQGPPSQPRPNGRLPEIYTVTKIRQDIFLL